MVAGRRFACLEVAATLNQHLKIVAGRDPGRNDAVVFEAARAGTPALPGFIECYPGRVFPDDMTSVTVLVHCVASQSRRFRELMAKPGFLYKGMMFAVEVIAFGPCDREDFESRGEGLAIAVVDGGTGKRFLVEKVAIADVALCPVDPDSDEGLWNDVLIHLLPRCEPLMKAVA